MKLFLRYKTSSINNDPQFRWRKSQAYEKVKAALKNRQWKKLRKSQLELNDGSPLNYTFPRGPATSNTSLEIGHNLWLPCYTYFFENELVAAASAMKMYRKIQMSNIYSSKKHFIVRISRNVIETWRFDIESRDIEKSLNMTNKNHI